MNPQNLPPERLDYSKVIEKLINNFPGLQEKEESKLKLGGSDSFTIIVINIPGFQYTLPIAKYSNNSVIRKSFEGIAKKIRIDIEEFDRDCAFQDN
ncbi:MAG: hypothetical protein GW938_07455 [Leptospira sp.]|nr:hypothetical protein [Leptospira sp.]